VALFATERVARNVRWLYHTAQVAVLGFIIGRLNVAVTGFEVVAGKSYVPAWTEIAVTGMLVTIGVVGFWVAARTLAVFERDDWAEEREATWQIEMKRQAALALAGEAGPAPISRRGG
jgi:Ni/Fe-hydrogenase subunit HybB-like protein